MIDVDVSMFSFKRRLGLRKKTNSSGDDMAGHIDTGGSRTSDEGEIDVEKKSLNLTRNTELMEHQ